MYSYTQTRSIHQLLIQLRDETIIPRPEFQRKLVWSNAHKSDFIDSVIRNYPLPEIFVAERQVDPDSGEYAEMLVDGQQRLTTLYEYVTGNSDLRLEVGVPFYEDLSESEKRRFLSTEIVVRVLSGLDMKEIVEVFARMNSTKYALNAMEINNARYDGALKRFAQRIADHEFFEFHRVFSSSDVRRMQDLRFVLELIATMLGSYSNGDNELEEYLERFNDNFEQEFFVEKCFMNIFEFAYRCRFPMSCRVWKKSDLFTFIIECNKVINRQNRFVSSEAVGKKLIEFYDRVDDADQSRYSDEIVREYYLASIHGSNSRSSRIKRGVIIESIFKSVV
ncbi:DUF262 domain-containing protein [Burkholderia vietnamiensis]|uniref:DUF262 domain-containing protein n=1 Tax=Burkholderia vietnamiensis TaxID=60552 RepID=UPI000841349B|nr:DUF262 domain-containing protein [Burkholderia vietnamiensis]MBR8084961.1 DUF262 domain-containing protein [Burkholderia vietnamiensis]HDR9266928.1 DUF262 domain-containing protein [Burkholderia vietnamiensis]